MSDAVIGIVTEAVLKMVVSLVAEEINLAWSMKKEFGKLREKLEMIQALLYGAQRMQITTPAVLLWLNKLKLISLEAQIVLEEFEYEVLRQKIKSRKRDKACVFCSSSNPISFGYEMAHQIKDVLSSLEQVYEEANRIGLCPTELVNSPSDSKLERLTFPFVEVSMVVGRDHDVSEVISMLTSQKYKDALPVITILGMGGQGKTTLAQLIYNNDKIKSHFEKLIWVCVSNNFKVERLLGEIWKSLSASDSQRTNGESLVKNLKNKLGDKKYLLVLDDVWNENGELWDRMRNCLLAIGGSKESKILVTTRSEKVASVMRTPKSGLHRLGILSKKESWKLFEMCTFAEGGPVKTQQLIELGKRILNRCGGVPLAIKAIGGLLYSESSEDEWSRIERSDIWSTYNEIGVLSVVELSYNNLPSLELKQCFAYCSIFQKDALIEKDVLIQLWAAQGLLNPSKGSQFQMEDLGDIYFNNLLRSSLLEVTQKDDLGNISHCKMHDIVHDVALQVSKNYTYHVKDLMDEGDNIDAMHVSVKSCEEVMWKKLLDVLPSKLRTLYLQVRGLNVYEDLFKNLQCLAVLIIEDPYLEELPNSIGKINHLKFLDISETEVRKLPNWITKLFHLQTLRLLTLDEDVPEGFGNLVNLRVIHFARIPKTIKIGKLINLRTLSHFTVDKSKERQIEDLGYLNNLKGELKIYGLQNVGSYEAAAKANLSKKSKIQSLELCWGAKYKEEEKCDDCDVMEGLQPHLNLKSLSVRGYQSQKLASWMANVGTKLFLRNLVRLELQSLYRCERLPSLGDLQFLQILSIESLPKVKSFGKEFYGLENLEQRNSCHEFVEITLFPALRSFYVRNMESLEEWFDPTVSIPTTHSSTVKVFPLLEDMCMYDLPVFSDFPNFGSLPCLRTLEVCYLDCAPLEFHQNYFPSLNELKICGCDKLASALCSSLVLPYSVPLEVLNIDCNPLFWPKDLHHLTNLRSLSLAYSGVDELDIDCLPWPYPASSSDRTSDSVHLMSLHLIGSSKLQKVTSLPYQIQYVTTLQTLKISGFQGLKFLPEWFDNLKCLQQLSLAFCPNLEHLPSLEVFRCLANLQSLEIYFCEMLKKECCDKNGSEWPKIAHIPNLMINYSIVPKNKNK